MKPLDEVITALEICDSAIDDCAHCAYYEDDCENLRPLRVDALHYLKMHRSDKLEWEAQKKAYEDWIEQYKDAWDKHQRAVIELKKKGLI